MRPSQRQEQWITGLVLLFLFALHLYRITNSPYEMMEDWRQSDTESIARNFVELRFNLFYPQVNYDGPAPNYVQLELQVTTFLIAILYKLIGYHYALARLVPVLFFMGSAWFLYRIARRRYSAVIGWLALVFYGLFPVVVYYSRTIQPESAALFFFVGAYDWFDRWMDEESNRLLVIAALFTAFAILEKVPAGFIGIAFLLMAVVKYKARVVLKWQLWVFAGIALLLPYAYYTWIGHIAKYQFVSKIATSHIFPQMVASLGQAGTLTFFQSNLPKAFTSVGLVVSLLGLLTLNWKREYRLGFWAIAMILEALTIVTVIKFLYYLIFLAPVMALLSARLMVFVGRLAKSAQVALPSVLSVVVAGVIGWQTLHIVPPWFVERQDVIAQGAAVQALTHKDDLIVVGSFDTAPLNACNRKGWRANLKYYDYIPQNPPDEIAYFIKHGAKYFVPLQGKIDNDPNGSYKKYLDAHFPKVEVPGGYSFYKLQ